MSTATANKTASKTDAAGEVKIGDAVKTLAGIFEKSITVAKDGAVTIEDGLIEANLPDDLSMAQIKRMQKHRGEVVAALSLALANKALPVMGKNKDLDKVHTSVKIGGDKLDLSLDRSREFNDGNGGKITKFGYLGVGYTATGATNAGEFKKVRTHIAEEARSLFG